MLVLLASERGMDLMHVMELPFLLISSDGAFREHRNKCVAFRFVLLCEGLELVPFRKLEIVGEYYGLRAINGIEAEKQQFPFLGV